MWTLDLDLDSAGPTKSGENLEQSDGRGYQELAVLYIWVMVTW